MRIGLLWYDPNPKADLATKIREAAQYFVTKYGCIPNRCYVNNSQVNQVNGASKVDGIEVHGLPYILPNHLWLGVENHTNHTNHT